MTQKVKNKTQQNSILNCKSGLIITRGDQPTNLLYALQRIKHARDQPGSFNAPNFAEVKAASKIYNMKLNFPVLPKTKESPLPPTFESRTSSFRTPTFDYLKTFFPRYVKQISNMQYDFCASTII